MGNASSRTQSANVEYKSEMFPPIAVRSRSVEMKADAFLRRDLSNRDSGSRAFPSSSHTNDLLPLIHDNNDYISVQSGSSFKVDDTVKKNDWELRTPDLDASNQQNLAVKSTKSSGIHQLKRIGASRVNSVSKNYAPSEPVISSRQTFFLNKKSSSHNNLASTSQKTIRNGISNGAKPTISASTSFLNQANTRRNQRNLSATNIPSKTIAIEMIAKNPESAIQEAIQKINSEEWKNKVEAINIIIQISEISAHSFCNNNLHVIITTLIRECKNLRSTVTRVAIIAFAALFKNLKANLDSYVEKICMILMQKAGDVSSAFIREDATGALEEMVKNASIPKVLSALIASGSKSKNNTTRSTCAGLTNRLIERVGAPGMINNSDLPKLISTLLSFAKDPNLIVRQHGKQGLLLLNQDPAQLDKGIRRHLSEDEIREVHTILDGIKKKGLEGSILDSSSNSLTTFQRSTSSRQSGRQRITKVPDSIVNDLNDIQGDLTANGWERRIGGLKKFEEMVLHNVRATVSDIKLMEAFIGRLNDINSKVSREAMEVYIVVLPKIARFFSSETGLRAIIYQLINALMVHLASKDEDQRELAQTCIRETITNIDKSALSPAFSASTRQANIKQKSFMLHSLNVINKALYDSKPKQVEVTALPVLWEILKTPSQMQSDMDVRQAVKEYANGLKQCIGETSLMSLANVQLTPSQKKSLQLLTK